MKKVIVSAILAVLIAVGTITSAQAASEPNPGGRSIVIDEPTFGIMASEPNPGGR